MPSSPICAIPEQAQVAIADLTTLRLGGPVTRLVTARTSTELVDVVSAADAAGEPVLLIGGGSNLVVGDDGWPGTVVRIATRGLDIAADVVTVAAGEPWDEVVRSTLESGLTGLETMSGIPGLTGATPVQNVGAYGSEVADVLTGLTVYDRESGRTQRWPATECGFGFRTSTFKRTDRWVVLDVTMKLHRSPRSRPVRYLELARRLDIAPGSTTSPDRVRHEVLQLRRSKAMVLDAADHDTWSVGSFFVNPLVDEIPTAAEGCPNWQTDGRTKLSAAWLIEQAGFHRGYALRTDSPTVAVSGKHTLALTHRGGGSTAELMQLAAVIRDGVRERFHITLQPEAHLRGCSF